MTEIDAETRDSTCHLFDWHMHAWNQRLSDLLSHTSFTWAKHLQVVEIWPDQWCVQLQHMWRKHHCY